MTAPAQGPFLDLPGFMLRWDGAPLTSAQQQQVKDALLVASAWIYMRKPGIAGPLPGPADPTAVFVVYEVVSTFIRYAKFAPLSSYHRATGHRVDAGTLSAEIQRYFTDDHKMLLGIPLRSLPMTSCRPNDFDAEDQHQGWSTRWSDRFGNLGWDYWTYSD